MSSIIVDFDDLENVTADVILADDSLEIVPEGLKIAQPVIDLIESSAQVPSIITTNYNWSGTFGDANGVLYGIGSNFGGTWSNPHTSGKIQVIRNNPVAGSDSDIVDRVVNVNSIDIGLGNPWIVIDLGVGRTLRMWDYLIRNGSVDGLNAPGNWVLEGCNDVASNDLAGIDSAPWDTIESRGDDTTIAQTVGSWGQFNLEETSAPYRWFRIQETGANQAGTFTFEISELEFYGEFTYGPEFHDGSLAAFSNPTTVKPLGDDETTPTTPGTPAGYIKFSVDGSNAWLPYYR